MRIFLRALPCDSCHARTSRMPVNSPCAPAAGCKRDRVHARDLEEAALQQIDDFKNSLRERVGAVGMGLGEAFDTGDGLVDARVVLHGAGAERIHAEVDGVVPGGEAGEVADDLDFAELGQQPGFCDARRPGEMRRRRRGRRAVEACRRACRARISRRRGLRSASGGDGLCRFCELLRRSPLCLHRRGGQDVGGSVDLFAGNDFCGAPEGGVA